jgi:putative transposase
LAWELSNTLDAAFCVRAALWAITAHGVPENFNTDQGCQFTSAEFTLPLLAVGVLSVDGRQGRQSDQFALALPIWRHRYNWPNSPFSQPPPPHINL